MGSNQPAPRDYWDSNLDAANLGGNISDSAASLEKELQFAGVPDIQAMLAWVGAPAPASGEAPLRTRKVLEIGSGLGANAVLLQRSGVSVVALDISHERLVALRARAADMITTHDNSAQIFTVKARAEALPFKTGVLDGAFTRAVLIHTEIPQVCAEVARALAPGAPVAFSEPMADNPLVNVYRRTLAPREWKGMTQYFRQREIGQVSAAFNAPEVRYYYLSAFVAFVFQYAVSIPRLFYPVLRGLGWFDKKLVTALPRSSNLAWFVLITGRTPK